MGYTEEGLMQGYKQVNGSHCVSESVASHVTNSITVQFVLMLHYLNPLWTLGIINVEGAFLQG